MIVASILLGKSMTDASSMIAKSLGVISQKQAEVGAVSATKRQELAGSVSPAQAYLEAAARARGDINGSLTPLPADPVGMQRALAERSLASGQYYADRSATRSGVSTAGDIVSSVGLGATNSVLGIGALGLGVLNDELGTQAAEGITNFTKWGQKHQSAGLQARRDANAALNQLDQQYNAAQFEAEQAQYGNFQAGINRMGRDGFSAVKNAFEDPAILADGVATGAGSLLVGGPIGKGLKAIGVAADVAMPLAIAAMEGGGAYQQTVQTALDKGASRKDANASGLIAAAIQAPVGALTGKLVSKFEASPLKVPSFVDGLANIGRETLEEGLQSASGQLSQNVGIKTVVDPSQSLTEGVGDQAALGALYGMGTAGVVQAPGLAAQGTAEAAKAIARTAAKAAAPILSREGKINEAGVARDILRANQAQATAVASALELEQKLQEAVASKGGKQAPELAGYITSLFNNVKFDPAEAENEAPVVRDAVQSATDRYAAMASVAMRVLDETLPESDRLAASAWITTQYQNGQSALDNELRAAVTEMSNEQFDALPQLTHFVNTMNGVWDHPTLKAAMMAGTELASNPKIQEQFSEAALSTPEGLASAQTTANAVIELAGADPAKADLKVLEAIRTHSVKGGGLVLSAQQKSILNGAYELVKQTKDFLEQKAALGLTHSDRVTQEIQTDDRSEQGASKIVKKSAHQHAAGVLNALRSGDENLARERLQDFMLFAQHMQNKVGALNASQVSGKNEPYSALSPNREGGKPTWFSNREGLGLQLRNEKSVKFAQRTALDARAVVNLANGLADALPQLGIAHLDPVPLNADPELTKKASQIVKEHNQSSSNQSDKQVKAKEVPVEQKPKAEVAAVKETKTEVKAEEPVVEKPSEPEAAKKVDQTAGQVEAKAAEKVSEPVAEPAAVANTESATKADPVEEASAAPSKLVGAGEGENWFEKAFKTPAEAISRLAGKGADTLSSVLISLGSAAAFEKTLGKKPSNKLTKDLLEDYQLLVGKIGGNVQYVVEQRLSAFLDKKLSSKDPKSPTFGEVLRNPSVRTGQPVQQYIGSKVLNLVQEEDGKLSYDPGMLEAAVLAGLQWLVNTSSRPSRELDRESLAEILGKTEEEIDDLTLQVFSKSQWLPDVIESLSSAITQFWGVVPDASVPEGYARGIPEAVAKEILKGLEEAGMIRNIIVDSFGNELSKDDLKALRSRNQGRADGQMEKTYARVELTSDEGIIELLGRMSAFPGAIEQLVLVSPQEERFIGEPPQDEAVFQMRNRLVRNSEQVKKAIKQRQNTPHKINTDMVALFEGLGRDLVTELFGPGQIDENVMNANHVRSMKGQQLSIEGAYDAMVSLLAELRNRAAAAGTDPSEMPVFYKYESSKVGRLQMVGAFSPQASKLTREFILPTRVTVDMTKDDVRAKFMLAVAQAWGEKVHKQPGSVSEQNARALADGKYAPALAAIEAVLDGAKPDSKFVSVLKDAFGDKLSPAAVHAAVELVKSRRSENPAAFVTDLYVEADGVTDGPINALVHLVTGSFTARWIELVAKGGLFVGRPGMTVNAFVYGDKVPKENKVDLYETATDILKERLNNYRGGLKAHPAINNQLTMLLELMDGLLGKDLSFDDQTGKLEFGRGLAKNPLTVSIYGSGQKGIANKIVGALTEQFYEECSKQAQGLANSADDMMDLLDVLTNVVVRGGKEGPYVKNLRSETRQADFRNDYKKLTLSKKQLENLSENVQFLFVRQLQAAIDDTIEGTGEGRNVARDVAQIQSIVLKHEFSRLIEERMSQREAADPNYRRSDFLSKADLAAIYKKLEGISPLVKTGGQILFAAGSDNTDIKASALSRSLSGDMETPARIYGPKDAGVKGIPFLVIASGDGQMMLNLFTGEQIPEGALDVFDGVHLKLDTLKEDGLLVNKAVHDAWQNNPLAGVAQSYQTFMKNFELDLGNQVLIEELAKVLKLEDAFPEMVMSGLEGFSTAVQKAADSAQARHNALARVQTSIDHMASIETPFQTEGEDLSGLGNEVAMAARLNDLMDKELAKIQESRAKKAKPDTDAKASPSASEEKAEAKPSSVVVTGASGLAKLVKALKIPAEQKNLLTEVVRALKDSGWEVVQGTKKDLAAYALSKGHQPHTGKPGEIVRGYLAPNQQRIYLHTDQGGGEPETLLHELLHAATTQKIVDHYDGQSTPEVAEAIARLEMLMDQWMSWESDLSGLETAQQKQAYRDALNAVQNAGSQAEALDEFLAWNLSNQDLIKVAQSIKVDSPVVSVVKKALVALKNLIWGKKNGPMVRSDMYSALRFNASVLINSAPTLRSRAMANARFQSVSYGNSDRLTDIHKRLVRKISDVVKAQSDGARKAVVQSRNERLIATIGNKTANAFIAAGFSMNMQEKSAFTMLTTVFATQAQLDPSVLGRVQEIYSHVNKMLTTSDFAPQNPTQAEEYAAARKLQAIRGTLDGRSIVELDDADKSTLMPAFLALAVVSDEFRGVLAKMDLPKTEQKSKDSLDNILDNHANKAMDALSRLISGEGRNKPNIQAAIDALTSRLVETVEEQDNAISQMANPVGRVITGLNDKIVGTMQDLSAKGIDKLKDAQSRSTNKVVRGALEVGKGALSVVNDKEARIMAEAWVSLSNRTEVPEVFRTFLNDMVGRTKSNAPIFDLIKPVRSFVQGVRQHAREHLPNLISNKFSRTLTRAEWRHLFHGLAKTDLASLRGDYSVERILELVGDQGRRTREIRRLETLVQMEAGDRAWRAMKPKAEQLAEFLATGTKGHHLLRNAEAVAGLYGLPTRVTTSPRMIKNVDQLVSLYALDRLGTETQSVLKDMVDSEAAGLSYTLEYLVGQRATEQEKTTTAVAKANHYKGYVPSAAQQGLQLIVAEDTERTRLEMLGFTRVGDYAGSAGDLVGSRGYYHAPLSSRSRFDAGVMQNVRQTASGVDPVTGFTHDGVMTAGRIEDPRKVRMLARYNQVVSVGSDENLMPVFDDAGQVVAYERGVDPRKEMLLNRDTHLARMIGVWRGRQAEESMAQEFNVKLVERLHMIWEEGQVDGRASEFVDLFGQEELRKDPVLADAISLLTPEAVDHIRQTFGGDGFMVRKDMINDAIGYRSASVGDLWTGKTRLPKGTVEVARKLAVTVFGTDAYRNFVVAEKFTQNLVSEARQTIVVRSIVVPVSNFLANIYQMTSRGVGLTRIARDMPKKLVEVSDYVKRRHRQLELEADLRAVGSDPARTIKINTELLSIEDANKRMSIWPLIEAGEFSSISEAGSLEKEELSIYEGKLTEYIEHKVDKLPGKLKTLVRYGIVTQDTALFQGMARAMEYGDFLAKAIRYDHLIQEKKMNQAEALASIGEEYINYDRLSGRFRGYAENMGLLWFYNFKIRAVKIALAAVRENPLHVLLTSLVPTPPLVGSVGTVVGDNMLSMAADGSLGWSIGPGMGFRAHDMNPWISLLDGLSD